MTPNLHTSEVRLTGPGDPDGGGKAGLKTPVRHTPNDHTWHYVSITKEDSTKLQVPIERERRDPARISVSNRHAVVPLRRIFYSDVSRAEPYVSVCNRSSRRATPGMACRIFSRASGVFAFLEEGFGMNWWGNLASYIPYCQVHGPHGCRRLGSCTGELIRQAGGAKPRASSADPQRSSREAGKDSGSSLTHTAAPQWDRDERLSGQATYQRKGRCSRRPRIPRQPTRWGHWTGNSKAT